SDASRILQGLGISVSMHGDMMNTLDGRLKFKVLLAQALFGAPDILLLDEPSNYLDVPAVEWLCKFLRNFEGTLILISHDRFLLNKLTNITLEVNGGAVERYNGNYDYYRSERENRSRCRESAKRNIDRRKEQMQRTIDRFRAKSSKAAQAQSLQKKLDKLDDVQLISDLNFMGSIRFPKPPPFGAEAARYEHVTFGYDGKQNIVEDISLQIDSGEKIAFIGYNGTGKTTLLKLLTAKLTPQQGAITLGHNIIPGYQAQEFADVLDPEQSVYDVVRAAMGRDFNLNSLPNLLGSFGFSQEAMNKPTKVLSGGEKIRLCFARIFVNPPNLLILDEP
ncbi:MAG: ATP-binding cassette domain-containing protein, partial [Victivallaceae bacterium]